jgi:hypothetical protein
MTKHANEKWKGREKRDAFVADLCRRLRQEGTALCMDAACELERERQVSNARMDIISWADRELRKAA